MSDNETNDDPRIPDLSKRENLIVHIEGLQAVLTERNKRIEELEAALSGEGESERAQRLADKSYLEGWKACANHMMAVTADAARELGKVRKDAWALYIEADSGRVGGNA